MAPRKLLPSIGFAIRAELYPPRSVRRKSETNWWGPEIRLSLDNGQVIKFSPKQATSLSYGQEAAHRLGLGIAIGVISPVLGAMVAIHKSKQHMIGIDFTDDQGLKQGLLLQADKSCRFKRSI